MEYKLYDDDDYIADSGPYVGVNGPYTVFLPDVVTRPDRWTTAGLGAIAPQVVHRLEELGYDQAPVAVPDSRIGYRLVSARLLRTLLDEGGHLAPGTGYMQNDLYCVTDVRLEVDALFDCVSTSRAVIVYEGSESGDRPEAVGHVLGLMSVTDLSKPAVRIALFRLMLDLETRLAALIDFAFTYTSDWIKYLNEDAKVRVLGRVELGRRSNIAVHPLEELYLREFLDIAACVDSIRTRLGFTSKSEMKDECGRIVSLRNAVMHPGRALILDAEGARRMGRAVRTALRLVASAGPSSAAG